MCSQYSKFHSELQIAVSTPNFIQNSKLQPVLQISFRTPHCSQYSKLQPALEKEKAYSYSTPINHQTIKKQVTRFLHTETLTPAARHFPFSNSPPRSCSGRRRGEKGCRFERWMRSPNCEETGGGGCITRGSRG